MCAFNVTPFIAQNVKRTAALDPAPRGRPLCSEPAEENAHRSVGRQDDPVGWHALRGVKTLCFKFILTVAGYNLIRLPSSSRAQQETPASIRSLGCHQ
jgi:hypothetical protein